MLMICSFLTHIVKLLVRNKVVAGLIHILEFEIVYKHSCGPGTLTISVEDTVSEFSQVLI